MSSKGTSKPKSQTYNTGGLYGNATTGKNGTTYNATDFEKGLVNQTTSAIPQYLQQLINPSYDSEIFKAQTAQRNRLANQSFENNLINPLASRGLTRGSSVNQLSGQFANKLADAETAAMANEDARVQNILNSLFNAYQVPYNNMTGITNQAQNLYNMELQRVAQENQNKGGMFDKIAGGVGSIMAGLGRDSIDWSDPKSWLKLGLQAGGAYLGGPAGGVAGSVAGNALIK